MIYQLKTYYGASINGKVIYSAELTFDDCTKLLTNPLDSSSRKDYITNKIIDDGFNPDDFTFGWVTKEQYENKIESKVDEEIEVKSN